MFRRAKRVIITFRGSLAPTEGNRDWHSNFNAFLTPMETPALLKGKLEGKLNERIMVHKGFYSKFFYEITHPYNVLIFFSTWEYLSNNLSNSIIVP